MPIRHCQNCGIKIIVDDDKATVFPFFCDLCHTKSIPKGGGNPEPGLDKTSVAPINGPGTPKNGTSACPNCGRILTIRIGERPIKSRCPECAKDLLLTPGGGARLLEDPDIMKFAKLGDTKTTPAVARTTPLVKPTPKIVTSANPSANPKLATAPKAKPAVAVKVQTQQAPAKPAPKPAPAAPRRVISKPDPKVDAPSEAPAVKRANPALVVALLLLPLLVGIMAAVVATDGSLKQQLVNAGLTAQKGAKKIYSMVTGTPSSPLPKNQNRSTP